MVFQVASIVFNDTASKYNQDLTQFLRRNLELAIRKGKLSFQFKIAKPVDITELRKMGVKRLPAMIIGQNSFIGVPNIIEEIRKRVKTSHTEAPEKSEDEIVRDFQMKALGKIKKDADGKLQVEEDEPEADGENSTQLLSKLNQEIARRGASIGHGDAEENTRARTVANRQPARNQERDADDDDMPNVPPPRRQNAPAPTPMRPDNLDNPQMQDALESLQRIGGKHANKDDMQDDMMMATLLNRMGGD